GSGVVYYCSYGGGECIEWQARHPEAKPVELILRNGKFSSQGGKYAGQKTVEARKNIIEDLQKAGAIEKIEPIKHTVFVHERCQTDVEYIETEQWFIKLLDKKDELLKRGQELRWFPERWRKNYENWVGGLKWDWCISRQRYYGVPFPVWYCKNCGKIIVASENKLPVDPMEEESEIKICDSCGSSEIIPETDVMDTWMTSSLTPIIASRLVSDEKLREKLYPMTLRPQAFEIIRTWLFYTIAKSHFHHNQLPFQNAMISGHGLDEQGRKISKRLGNYIAPDKIIAEYGADALRYWATGAALGENMRYSSDEVKMGKKTINKLWNAAKFSFSHLENFDLEKSSLDNLEPADQWILNELLETLQAVEKYFEEYEYSKARNRIETFFWNSFTDNYLEFIKYRLYDDGDSVSAKAAKVVLYQCLLAIIKMYAPIMPFITEEIYQSFFKKFEKEKSIHISTWPEIKESWKMDDNLKKEFTQIIGIISDIRKFKSEKNISLGKEIENFEIKAEIDLAKYEKFICKATRVKSLTKK
ncbi:MAG TPA: valine--tRNA ligase, partial [Candidatus Moranbacteria bacterium]|nr:valine--tRNA ligase [Candidatus Moranbacteria bacterium]